jgi:uncharacterized damage-inducible protein DinB
MRDLFRSFTAREAAAHPVPGAHSAWEIANHLAFWYDVVRRRLSGKVVDYEEDEDWPAPGKATNANWQEALDALDRSHRNLVNVVRRLDPRALDRLAPGNPFTIYTMLHGATQHAFYHCGQVSLLRKALHP